MFHLDSRGAWPLVLLVLAISLSQSALTLAQTPHVGAFGPSIPFETGISGSSGVTLNDGTVLLTGGSTIAYTFDPRYLSFSPTGPLAAMHTSSKPALLPDGRVLLASGGANPTETRSEIYNPATNTWTLTGSLNVPRQWATVLTDVSGRIFLLGGKDTNGQELGSIIRYDPTIGQFVAAGSLLVPRAGAAAVRLANGRFLLVGGTNGGGYNLRSAEIYDPSSGVSIATGDISFPTSYANLVLLQDGRALLTGGSLEYLGTSLRVSNYAEVFNPATGQFTRMNMTWDRVGHSATVLPSGEVLLMGGFDDFGQCLTNTEIFNPIEANLLFAFRRGPPMPNHHCFHTAATLTDGSILVAGGGGGDYGVEASETADHFFLDAISRSGFEFQ
ncbi:Galactose oxidase, central domain [Dokdonella immobilis]|uniref:Galactose oxidase, central domain n=1 Tax=Dokdonella immobilis TaxID=578942 RepID=A0A1I4Z682_9GAMM|nr:Galactose oxidase, central domain [Dokdonella immobilis]